MRKKLVVAGSVILATAVVACREGGSPTAPVSENQSASVQSVSASAKTKTDICHLDDDGLFHVINVSDPALPEHLAHGDHLLLSVYADGDGDGYGAGTAQAACEVTAGFADNDNDCDDSDGGVNPGAVEVCGDGVDNDCDGQIDEDCTAAICPCEDQSPISGLFWSGEETCSDSGDEVTLASASGAPLASSSAVSGATECTWVHAAGIPVAHSSGHSVDEALACNDVIRQQAESLGASCS